MTAFVSPINALSSASTGEPALAGGVIGFDAGRLLEADLDFLGAGDFLATRLVLALPVAGPLDLAVVSGAPVFATRRPGLALGRGLAPGRVDFALGLLALSFRPESAVALLPGLPLGLPLGLLFGFVATLGVGPLGLLIDLGSSLSATGEGPNSTNVNSPSLFLSSVFKALTAASISLRDNLPSLLASNAINSCDGLGLALTIVGPEADRCEPSPSGLAFGEAAGFAALGLPLGFAADWAKPFIAKPNPNVTAIAVFFMILISIVKLTIPMLTGIIRFG